MTVHDRNEFFRLLHEGISEFNNGRYFEAHDVLEALWMETSGKDRLFLQGLIQVSVGFYHLSNKNFRGAVSQFTKGLLKLENYLPSHCGVELGEFVQRVGTWRELAQRGLAGQFIEFSDSGAPRIHLTE